MMPFPSAASISLHALLGKKLTLLGITLGSFVVALAFDWTAFATAVVAIVGAIAGAVVIIVNAVAKMRADLMAQTAKVQEDLQEQATRMGASAKHLLETTNVVATDVKVVKGQVDGMTSTSTAKIAALERQVADQDRRADLLAQALATKDAAAASQTPIVVAVPPKDG
jgi:hypothetical protein